MKIYSILFLIASFFTFVFPSFGSKADIVEDSANTEYLQGQGRRIKENAVTLKTKGEELMAHYKVFVKQYPKKKCEGVYVEAKAAVSLSKNALKCAKKADKQCDKAIKSKKMKPAQRAIRKAEELIEAGIYYRLEAEKRDKEIQFEMKGC